MIDAPNVNPIASRSSARRMSWVTNASASVALQRTIHDTTMAMTSVASEKVEPGRISVQSGASTRAVSP